MASLIQRIVNRGMRCDIAEAPNGSSFELTSPATGQRFRVTVAEVSADHAVDAVIAAFGRGEQ
jgi:hypothetical protein